MVVSTTRLGRQSSSAVHCSTARLDIAGFEWFERLRELEPPHHDRVTARFTLDAVVCERSRDISKKIARAFITPS
jgi:hypothetical protein